MWEEAGRPAVGRSSQPKHPSRPITHARRPGDRTIRREPIPQQVIHLQRPRRRRLTVPLLVLLWFAFAGLVTVGGLLLRWPATWQKDVEVSWWASLFTALSATATAGFDPVDIATTWNWLGQGVILLLVEAGGLIYVATITLLFATVRRRTVVFEAHHIFGLRLGEEQLTELMPLLQRLNVVTLMIQLGGAILLLPGALRERDFSPETVWWVLFLAVTAFHNTGFDLEPGFRSLAAYEINALLLFPMILLNLLGATGFPVLSDLAARRSWRRLYPDTRLVLLGTLALLIVGTAGITFLEWNNPATLGGLTGWQRFLGALATTVTRTGGPRVFDTRMLTEEGSFLLGALTFIGGASGSVAGGVKVQTFSLLLLAIIATVRGSRHVVVFGREVPDAQVFRGLALAIFALLVTFWGTVLLAALTPQELPVVWLLAVQAFGLAGAESELVANLGLAGQVILAFLVILGRFGLLVIALVYATQVPHETVHYAPESVRLG